MVMRNRDAKDGKTKVKFRLTQNQLIEVANKHGVEDLFLKDEHGLFITGLPQQHDRRWIISRSHISKAIKYARNSMPGAILCSLFYQMKLLLP